MRSNRTKAYFVISLCLASFGYGVVTVRSHIFPFALLQNANRAWGALTADADDTSDRDVVDVQGLTEPTVRRHSEAAGDELILVAGGESYLQEHSRGHGCLAWIMDRQGRLVHVWHYDPEVWAHLDKIATVPGRSRQIHPVGLHLYPNGDLLVSFQGSFIFPYSIGLARFDKDSKLLWKKELLTHHWFTIAADGRIISPALQVIDSPSPIGDTRFSMASPDGKILDDRVLVLDPNGEVLDEINVLEAVIESGWAGLLPTQNPAEAGKLNQERFTIASGDPTHLNGIQIVGPEVAAAHPWLNEGDLLLSMRNINAVGILDPHTKRFKWMSAGASIQQHNPRFYDQGVLVLDNRGGSVATGGSRLVHVDLETRLPSTVFPRPSASLPGEFYTSLAGQFELGESNRLLMAINLGQKIWEIDIETGQVLWEYLCVDSQQHRRRHLATAQYVRQVDFPFNQQGEQRP
ncbi:MAG TPA: arylsulfotransferase family protein [Planctomycetaceae bacterium]|jgi:hypothetical protein